MLGLGLNQKDKESAPSQPAQGLHHDLFRAPREDTEKSRKRGGGGGAIVPILLLALLFAVIGGAVVLMRKGTLNMFASSDSLNSLLSSTPFLSKPESDTDDLGQGVANDSGIRGHLVTSWKGKALYMLKIEPLDPRYGDGFALVTAHPAASISIHARLLDSAGTALCEKEIVLGKPGSPPAKAQHVAEEDRVSGQEVDAFKSIVNKDSKKVEALWAEGELPCSADEYKHIDYWTLTTNFPTVADQKRIAEHTHDDAWDRFQAAEKVEREKYTPKPFDKEVPVQFSMEGDERATSFDSARGILFAGPAKSFVIDKKGDQATVANWASNLYLVHFKCDQHGVCAINPGGSSTIIFGRLNK
jgi:hypothetical protein